MVACAKPSPMTAAVEAVVASAGAQRSGEISTRSRRRLTRMEWRTPFAMRGRSVLAPSFTRRALQRVVIGRPPPMRRPQAEAIVIEEAILVVEVVVAVVVHVVVEVVVAVVVHAMKRMMNSPGGEGTGGRLCRSLVLGLTTPVNAAAAQATASKDVERWALAGVPSQACSEEAREKDEGRRRRSEEVAHNTSRTEARWGSRVERRLPHASIPPSIDGYKMRETLVRHHLHSRQFLCRGHNNDSPSDRQQVAFRHSSRATSDAAIGALTF